MVLLGKRGDVMFTKIIETLDMPFMRKTLMTHMAQLYEGNLPGSLYLNHYQLAKEFGFTHENWGEFLKIREIDRLIESEIAQIAEIGAREALKRLQSGNAASVDIQAAKELIANSKLIKQRLNQRQQIIITRMQPKEVAKHG